MCIRLQKKICQFDFPGFPGLYELRVYISNYDIGMCNGFSVNIGIIAAKREGGDGGREGVRG